MFLQNAIVTTGQEPGQPGQIRVNYTPRRGGKQPVEVKWNQQHIMGSPFYVDVLDLETLAIEGEGFSPMCKKCASCLHSCFLLSSPRSVSLIN